MLFSINFPTAVRQAINGYQMTQAGYGTVYACRYGGSKAFTALVFRAVWDSNSSTKDYCTVELASAAKLTQYSLRSPIKGEGTLFIIKHATNVVTHRVYNQGIQSYYLEALF